MNFFNSYQKITMKDNFPKLYVFTGLRGNNLAKLLKLNLDLKRFEKYEYFTKIKF